MNITYTRVVDKLNGLLNLISMLEILKKFTMYLSINIREIFSEELQNKIYIFLFKTEIILYSLSS